MTFLHSNLRQIFNKNFPSLPDIELTSRHTDRTFIELRVDNSQLYKKLSTSKKILLKSLGYCNRTPQGVFYSFILLETLSRAGEERLRRFDPCIDSVQHIYKLFFETGCMRTEPQPIKKFNYREQQKSNSSLFNTLSKELKASLRDKGYKNSGTANVKRSAELLKGFGGK